MFMFVWCLSVNLIKTAGCDVDLVWQEVVIYTVCLDITGPILERGGWVGGIGG